MFLRSMPRLAKPNELSQTGQTLWSTLFVLFITSTAAASTASESEEKLRDGDEFANNLISDLAPLLAL
jgi:hypothetical protein